MPIIKDVVQTELIDKIPDIEMIVKIKDLVV